MAIRSKPNGDPLEAKWQSAQSQMAIRSKLNGDPLKAKWQSARSQMKLLQRE